MKVTVEPMPKAPKGYVACRVISRAATTTHLVLLDEEGNNGGRPTVCGLTRFDKRDPETRKIVEPAGLPGWGMGDSGLTGTDVAQIKCEPCYEGATK